MACKCIQRQKWLVDKLCAAGVTRWCERAKERLARMEAADKRNEVIDEPSIQPAGNEGD
jgi:hypothetical protein